MGFMDDLAEVAGDPVMRRLAERRAGSRELAQDALQETYLALAQWKNPEDIRDLRAFFYTALIHEINHQSHARLVAAEDIAAVPEQELVSAQQGLQAGTEDVAALFEGRLLAETLLARLDREKDSLAVLVPARSSDPHSYRAAIIAAAAAILRMLLMGNVGPGDWNVIITSKYPQWFEAARDVQGFKEAELVDRRLSRARRDVRQILHTVAQRTGAVTRPSRETSSGWAQAGEPGRTPDDVVLTALYVKAEQTRLPHEPTYNQDRGRRRFTAWLDRQAADPVADKPATGHRGAAQQP